MSRRTFLPLPALLVLGIALASASTPWAREGEPRLEPGDPDVGRSLLLEKAYIGPSFDQETFDAVWRVWPEPLRSRAEGATPEARRRMAYDRYGLDARPGDPAGRPVQYVVDDQGRWSMSCFACHAGRVAGRVRPGLPNSHFALQTLSEETRATKRLLGKRITRADLGQSLIPLNTTNGTTNAVMFSVSMLSYRDVHLNFRPFRLPPRLRHHDMDAPPWWNLKKRTHLYIDGFAPKGARPLMQFTLVPENGPEQLRAWEQDFEHILAYVDSIEAPSWPYETNPELAARGRTVFDRSCSTCHGTYGELETYPNRRVPIETIGTDRLRLDAVTAAQHRTYARSWFTHYDPRGVSIDPGGYVAPPLDGIWASAPYLHNGSVPTLWHLLRPDRRPSVWRRTRDGYDRRRVGLEVEILDVLPEVAEDPKVRRTFFDTSARGKSAAGHLFPDALTDADKRAVLEYLKTL